MIAQLEKDLAEVVKAIEQAFANVNILQGQKQGLEHALRAIKAAADVTETVTTALEGEVIPAAPVTPTQGE